MHAEIIGWVNPVKRIGSKPLSRGRKAPPQPATQPQKIGPNTGKLKSDGAIVAVAATTNFTTTAARKVSYNTISGAFTFRESDFRNGNKNKELH